MVQKQTRVIISIKVIITILIIKIVALQEENEEIVEEKLATNYLIWQIYDKNMPICSWSRKAILKLKSKQKHFEVEWKSRKGAMLRLFSHPKRLDGLPLASFNFIALLHKTVVNSGNCGPTVYLCATKFYICARFYFIFVRKLLSAICGAITGLISLHTSSGSINATSMTMSISHLCNLIATFHPENWMLDDTLWMINGKSSMMILL